MEIVNIEAGTFKEMVTAWNSLKSELKELQNIYLRKEPDEWHSFATWMARLCHQGENYWHNISLIYCDIKRVQEYIKAPTRTTALTYGVF